MVGAAAVPYRFRTPESVNDVFVSICHVCDASGMTGAETVTARADAAGALEMPPAPSIRVLPAAAERTKSPASANVTPESVTSRSRTAAAPPANTTNGASPSKSGAAEFSQLPAVVMLSSAPPPVHVYVPLPGVDATYSVPEPVMESPPYVPEEYPLPGR